MAMRVLYVGDRECREFRDPARWLEIRTAASFVARFDERQLRDQDPHCLIFAQQRPGTFSWCHVETAFRITPLARIVGLLGTWCEGELRTGRPWPGVTRVYWHQWRPRFERLFFDKTVRSPWRIPRSASDAELLLAAHRPVPRRSERVVVDCSDRRYGYLHEALRVLGYDTERLTERDGPRESLADDRASRVLLFDTDRYSPQALDRLAYGIERCRPIGTVVATDFIRCDEWEQWKSVGASQLLARPWLLDDLEYCLGNVRDLPAGARRQRGAA